jgi:hypothetical protein
VSGDEGLLVGGDVLLERNGLVLRRQLEAAQGCVNLVNRDVQPLGDESDVGVDVFDLLAEEVAGDGGVVVDEQAAFAVEEASARGEDGDLADSVGLGEDAVAIGADDLEAPETHDEGDEDKRDYVLRDSELERGELLFAAEWVIGTRF